MAPGEIALTRMFEGASSAARDLVKPSIPALLIE